MNFIFKIYELERDDNETIRGYYSKIPTLNSLTPTKIIVEQIPQNDETYFS